LSVRNQFFESCSDPSLTRIFAPEKENVKKEGPHLFQAAKQKVIALEQHAVKDLKDIAQVAKDAIALPEAPYGPPGYVSPDPDRYGHLSHEERLHLLENRQLYRDQPPRSTSVVPEGADDSSSAVVRGATASIPLWRNEMSSSDSLGSQRRYREDGSVSSGSRERLVIFLSLLTGWFRYRPGPKYSTNS
jgi:hypothetical protein